MRAEIRRPWPDEMPRVKHFLPHGFLFDPDPFVLVAVFGRVERFVGALAFTLRPLQNIRSIWLCLRVENEHPCGADLLQRGLEEAWKAGTDTVYFGQTIDENSPTATALQNVGFAPSSVHEVYEMDPKPLFERLDRVYQKLRARNRIPTDIEVTTLQPAVVPKVRKFLMTNMPSSASALALETGGYKAEHSIALIQNSEVKGVLLSRRAGKISYTGLRVVAEELRGGFGWANLILMHTSIASGLQTGLEVIRFEFDPKQHHDTQQFADLSGARLVTRRFLFRIDNPEKND